MTRVVIPLYFPFPLFLSDSISLRRILCSSTDLGIHMSLSSWRTQPWARGILWNRRVSAHSQPGSTGAAPIFHEVNVRQSFSARGAEFQGTQTSCPAPSFPSPAISWFCNLTPHSSPTSSCPPWFHIPPTACQNPTHRTLYLWNSPLRNSLACVISRSWFLAHLSSQVCYLMEFNLFIYLVS